MDGVRHVSSTTKRLDVVAWLLFIRINAVVAAMSDFPVEKYGPDRPDGSLFVEPLMIDLTSVPAIQDPNRPMIVCMTTMAVVTSATDGGLLSPLRECAIAGANAQNGTNHTRMKSTPTRRRNGDIAADLASSLVDLPSGMFIPTLLGALGSYSPEATVLKPTMPRAYDRAGVIPQFPDDQRFTHEYARREPVPVSSATILRMILRTCRAAASR
jgi:hypothetical protein